MGVSASQIPQHPKSMVKKQPPPRPSQLPKKKPVRVSSFIIPENKVLPSEVQPRQLRKVSTLFAEKNPDFAFLYGQQENQDNDKENAKRDNSKGSVPLEDPPMNLSLYSSEFDAFKANDRNKSGLLSIAPDYETCESPNFLVQEHTEKVVEKKLPNILSGAGNYTEPQQGHRRFTSSSTLSSGNKIQEKESEEQQSVISETFSQMSLPRKSSFNMDVSYSLTYAQLAEMRRKSSVSVNQNISGDDRSQSSFDGHNNKYISTLQSQEFTQNSLQRKPQRSPSVISAMKEKLELQSGILDRSGKRKTSQVSLKSNDSVGSPVQRHKKQQAPLPPATVAKNTPIVDTKSILGEVSWNSDYLNSKMTEEESLLEHFKETGERVNIPCERSNPLVSNPYSAFMSQNQELISSLTPPESVPSFAPRPPSFIPPKPPESVPSFTPRPPSFIPPKPPESVPSFIPRPPSFIPPKPPESVPSFTPRPPSFIPPKPPESVPSFTPPKPLESVPSFTSPKPPESVPSSRSPRKDCFQPSAQPKQWLPSGTSPKDLNQSLISSDSIYETFCENSFHEALTTPLVDQEPPAPLQPKNTAAAMDRKTDDLVPTSDPHSVETSSPSSGVTRINSLLKHDIITAANKRNSKPSREIEITPKQFEDPHKLFQAELEKAYASRQKRSRELRRNTRKLQLPKGKVIEPETTITVQCGKADTANEPRKTEDPIKSQIEDAAEPEKSDAVKSQTEDAAEPEKSEDAVKLKIVDIAKPRKAENAVESKIDDAAEPRKDINQPKKTTSQKNEPDPPIMKSMEESISITSPTAKDFKLSRYFKEPNSFKARQDERNYSAFSKDWIPEQDLIDDFDDNSFEQMELTNHSHTINGFKSSLIPGNLNSISGAGKQADYKTHSLPAVNKQKIKKSIKGFKNPFVSSKNPPSKLILWKNDDSPLDDNSNWKFTSDENVDENITKQMKKSMKKGLFQKKNGSSVTKFKDEKPDNFQVVKRAGIAYIGGRGEIVVLPDFQTIKVQKDGMVIDDDGGRAPKLRDKKKKFKFKSTFRQQRECEIDKMVTENVQKKEIQMEEERRKQLEIDEYFKNLREEKILDDRHSDQKIRQRKSTQDDVDLVSAEAESAFMKPDHSYQHNKDASLENVTVIGVMPSAAHQQQLGYLPPEQDIPKNYAGVFSEQTSDLRVPDRDYPNAPNSSNLIPTPLYGMGHPNLSYNPYTMDYQQLLGVKQQPMLPLNTMMYPHNQYTILDPGQPVLPDQSGLMFYGLPYNHRQSEMATGFQGMYNSDGIMDLISNKLQNPMYSSEEDSEDDDVDFWSSSSSNSRPMTNLNGLSLDAIKSTSPEDNDTNTSVYQSSLYGQMKYRPVNFNQPEEYTASEKMPENSSDSISSISNIDR